MSEISIVAPDPTGQQVFTAVADELLMAIELLLRSRLVLAGLMLLYAGIDIMAWLDRRESHADVRRDDFIEWVERYLLPDRGLPCTAEDLYGARCGLLHSSAAESKLSRIGRAREIFYAWGENGKAEALQRRIDHSGTRPAVAVHGDHLFYAFRVGIKRFKESLANDPGKANSVYVRARKFFSYVPPSVADGDLT